MLILQLPSADYSQRGGLIEARPAHIQFSATRLAESLSLRAAVALETLLDVLAELSDVYLGRFGGVLKLLQRDVLRIAMIGFRLVTTA
jgi:hypothetical protein